MNKRVLILSGIPWNTTFQRHHKISLFLNNLGYEVIFVEKIPSSKFSINKLFSRIAKKFEKVHSKPNIDNFNVKIINMKFVNPMEGLFWLVNKHKSNRLISSIGDEFDIVVNYLPVNTTYYIIDNLKVKKNIYDCVRDFENWGGYPKNINDFEGKIVLKSDMILTDSFYLTNKMKERYQHKEVLQVLPTISEEQEAIISNSKVKEKIVNILYFGTIGDHVDVDILNKLADDGYQVHVIGEMYSGIKLNGKIITHGFVNNSNLLAEMIVNYADAVIIPYRGNMNGVIPAKLMQCIATGLPIFISNFYDSVVMKRLLYVYDDYNDLKYLIENYNKENHLIIKNRMVEFSKNNSEESQFSKLTLILND